MVPRREVKTPPQGTEETGRDRKNEQLWQPEEREKVGRKVEPTHSLTREKEHELTQLVKRDKKRKKEKDQPQCSQAFDVAKLKAGLIQSVVKPFQ